MIKPLPPQATFPRSTSASQIATRHARVRLNASLERERHASSCPHALHTERYAMSEIPRADEVPVHRTQTRTMVSMVH